MQRTNHLPTCAQQSEQESFEALIKYQPNRFCAVSFSRDGLQHRADNDVLDLYYFFVVCSLMNETYSITNAKPDGGGTI
jgi:hypothetical protein